MQKALAFSFAFCMVALGAQAQKTADFSGKWTLDVAKSKLGERSNIEAQTLIVTQTAKDIKIETSTKRAGAAPTPLGGGRGFVGGGDMPATYALDGKDARSEVDGPGGAKVPVITNGKVDGSKMTLSRSSTFNGPNGLITSSTKEMWELGPDGKTLTITTERVTFRGTDKTTRVFTKS
jgi:hypothetical protein